MKTPAPQSGIFNPRVLLAFALCSAGVFLAMLSFSAPAASSSLPSSGPFTAVGPMTSARYLHSATLLGNGKVLIAGGYRLQAGATVVTNTAELFDPASGAFTLLPHTMTSRRQLHTATLLPSGKVLIAGGAVDFSGTTNTAELFDPASATFTPLPPMNSRRDSHTATLLPSGKVLIAGGFNGTTATNIAEVFDPDSGTFTSLSPAVMTSPRNNHTATLLPDGKVLIAGGFTGGGATNTAELFDPASGSFTRLTSPMTSARNVHTATLLANGKVLIAGGQMGVTALNTAELFDPVAGTFTLVVAIMNSPRYFHTATQLPSGKVLITGGTPGGLATNTAELFDPDADIFTLVPSPMTSGRYLHTATLLPSGHVLIAGGHTGSGIGTGPLNTAEVFDPTSPSFASLSPNTMTSPRYFHSATLLSTGKVLIAGGATGNGGTNTAELFDPNLSTFRLLPPMNSVRNAHTATLLQNGMVLIAGGLAAGKTAELFDPASESFTSLSLNTMSSERYDHTATLLPSGKVLIAGGSNGITGPSNTADLFDPVSRTFTPLSPNTMTSARQHHTATMLPRGKVFIAGGSSGSLGTAPLNTAELFDPDTRTFTAIANTMTSVRQYHTATLLPNGKVLIAGGDDGTAPMNTAELFDPDSGTFAAVPNNMNSIREAHTATLLASGKVLIAGGTPDIAGIGAFNTTELFDPASETFTSVSNTMTSPRYSQTATLLASGKVLLAGGHDESGETNSAELFDPGLAFSDVRRPIILTVPTTLIQPAPVTVTGTGFRGDSEASGSSFSNSATNYPILQLQKIDNEQTMFVLSDPTTNWSDTTFSSETLGAVTPLPPGHYRVTIFTNAIPSVQKIVKIGLPVQLVSVVSRKIHGTAGTFDVDLPLTGPRGIECRSGGTNGDYTLVFTFANTLTSVAGASIASGTGSVVTSNIDSNDAHKYIVNLTGVTNVQYIRVTLTNVNDSTGNSSISVPGPSMGVLIGDVNASGVVTSGDTNLCKAQALQPVTSATFRNDVNVSGSITTGDVNIIKQNALSQLPP